VRFTGVYRPPLVERNVEVATGSGFVIAPSGLVLTNLHVVSEEPSASFVDGQEAEITVESRRIEVAIGPGGSVAVLDGAVVAQDPDLDLAVLQVTAADLPYLPFGDSDVVESGRRVQVLGFPFGRMVEVGKEANAGVVPQVTVTAGSLSAAREDDAGDRRYLQTDAAVQPGNSGGPMLDEDGYAVGSCG
jgi:serine protease Do